MASSDEAKVKLSADVSSFNSAISSAKSTITELNSALRLVQTQMNTSGSSTDQLQQKLTTLQEKSKALATEEEALKGKLDATKAVYGENSTEAQKLQTQLNNVQTQEEKVTQEINKTTEALEQQQKAEEQASSASGQLSSTIQQQESELAELKTQYTNVVLEEGKDSEAAQELAGKITTLNGELQENKAKLADAEGAAEDLTEEEKNLGDEGENAGDKMSEGFQVAYQALAAAGLIEAVKQLVDALKECVEVAADFESQMSTVQALSGATSDEMDALTAAAKEMGATTKFTATESAEALEYMALAGWDTEEMMDGLPGIINLAAAAGEDLASTSDIVTDALTAFGMSASDSAHFSDVLAAASTNSNTTVSQMGEAFKQVATTAGTLGYSIDDVSVALGLMADNGLKGSSAGTALSTALTRMSGANATATKELDELNVSMFNADGSTKDLATFLGELRTALNENCTSSEEMQVALYNLAGQKGMKGLAAIVNTTDEDFDSLTNAIADCDGCAEEMADIRMDNFEGSVTLLKSAFDGLETTIGEAALPALSSFVDILTSMVGGINNFLVAHEGATQAVIAITVAVVAFTAAILACSVGMEALKKAINAVTTALESNPFGMALAAVTALAAGLTALVAMYRNTDTEQNNLRKDVKALTQEIDDQRDAYDELCESNEETARNYSDLADELNNLLSQTDKEASDYARISAIVDELNGYLGENVVIYDEETDSINMTAEALDNLVESQNKTTEYEAALERQSELYEDQAQLTEELARAQEDLDGVLTGVTETEGMNAFQLAAAGQAATGAAERSADYQQAVYDLQAELDATNAELDEVNEQINEYSAVTEEAAGTTEGEITVAVEDLAEKLISLQTEYDEAYESAYESISGQFDLWEQLDEVTTTTFEDAMAAMETQREYWKDYADNVEELMNRNIDGLDELVLAYCDGSMESAGYIASLAEMNDEEIEQIIFEQERLSQQQYRLADETADAYTGMSEATDAAIQECIAIIMDLDQSDEAREAAYETLAGYISGYEDEEGEVTGEVQRVKDSALEEFRNEANISEARSAGSDTGKAYPEGILEASTEVGTATSQIVQAGIEGYSSSEGPAAAKSAGTEMGQGLAEGITSTEGEVTSAAQSVGDSGTNAFEMATNASITQPIGMNFVQGAVQGVNGMASSFVNATGQTATQGVNKFKSTLGVSSPSTIANSAGSDFIQGGINGVNAKKGSFESATRSAAQSGVSAFKNVCNSSALYGAGSDAIQGAINGANAKGTAFSSTMSSIASSAMASFKASLGTASPSWIAEEAAEYVDEGAIIGAENKAGDLIKAFGNVGAGAMDAFQDSLNADSALQATVNGDGIISVYDQLSSKLNGIATDIEISNAFDYDKLAAAMARQNIVVKYNDRELGRAVREVM